MTSLVPAAAFFVLLHVVVAGTRLRDAIIRRVGQGAYLGLFSLASVAGVVWLARAYSAAYASGNVMLWSTGGWTKHAAAPVMIGALLLAVPGLLSPNPTAVRGEAILKRAPEPSGIHRVTRHPFLWGVAIWAAFHLLANGDRASVLLFSSFLVVSLLGTRSIDRKRARALGSTWERYRSATSNVPFGAALAGRTRLSFREIGWWRPVAALVVFAVLVSLHPMLFGAYPLPNMAD
jgi:uncharacterized membrane protein